MHVSNDNPVEPEELAQLRTERTRTAHPLGDLPLIVVSRGQQESPGPTGHPAEEEHQQEQAAFARLSRAGALVSAAKSGHHVPIEEPESVIQAIRRMIAAETR
jgi:hypothetical protein